MKKPFSYGMEPLHKLIACKLCGILHCICKHQNEKAEEDRESQAT